MKNPVFNLPTETKALYCFEHKLDNMIDVTHIKCSHNLCNKSALYNLPESLKPMYCSIHKSNEMIDIVSKKCKFDGCTTIPYYNYSNEKNGLYCCKHKLENMVDVKSLNCIIDGCFNRAMFNEDGKKPLYCKQHKKDSMKDIINRCKSEFCETFIQYSQKYDGYCLFCFIHLFPENKITTNYKTKEKAVVDFVKNKFNYDWIYDKKIFDGCSKRRPDLLLDLGFQIIIIEIDENQHCKYDSICENKRIMEISKDLGHRNIVFIRFNPDKYYENNNLIDSCWIVNKKGHLKIKCNDQWNERLNILKNEINYWINNQSLKMINIINLFFDKNI